MYPVYCIALTFQKNNITQPIYLDVNFFECYLLRWKLCLKNVQLIHFFKPFHISKCLFQSYNVYHDVFILRDLHSLFYEWMHMVDTFNQYMVAFFLVITEDLLKGTRN